MSELVAYSVDGDIAVLTVNNPPVNALSPGVPEGIRDGVAKAGSDPAVKAIVLIGGGQTFIAGADIREFGKLASGERKRDPAGLNPILNAIEDSAKPVVAALHGTALGGGLETAMACHFRVAVPSAKVGQPEVKLGLIPGAAGTQRLPRLAGVIAALEMCVAGEPITAQRALELGIVDRLIDGDLLAGAVAFAREQAASGNAPKTRDRNEKIQNVPAEVFAQARQMTSQKARGQLAPFHAIDAVEAATKLPFDEGVRKEGELFAECLVSPQSKSLIHVFFSERAVAKIPDIDKSVPLLPIRKAAVVGAGTMGGGIAMNYVNAGIPVILKETTQEALDRGLAIIQKNYANTVSKGKLSQEQMDKRMALITPTLSYDGFDQADIITEAVFEDMGIKKGVFAELDKVCRPDAILASNTSTLDIDQIAAATSRPAQVIGHHYFSPANVMRLLEIVRGSNTAKEVIATSMNLSRTLRKVGVLVGNCQGFVGNRMVDPYGREARFLVEEGASPQQVDRALTEFGMAMGPLAMSDLAGLDVVWRVQEAHKSKIPAGRRVSSMVDRLYKAGRYGQKTGKGWFRYEPGSRAPLPDPEVDAMVAESAKAAGITRRAIDDAEIVERTIYALINEGANILDEKIALRASDIDIIYVYGYGFPPHKGGPMKYADLVGLDKVYARIEQFHREHGDWWKPSRLLKELAEQKRTFADLDKGGAG